MPHTTLDAATIRDDEVSTERLKPATIYTAPVTFHYEIQNHTTRMQKLTKAFRVYRLTVLTIICIAAGLIIGLLSRPFAKDWTERQFMYIELPGELYLRLLKLIIIPLLVTNVILSFGTIRGKLSSYLGKIAGFFYLSSNLLAITLAIILVLFISPGKKLSTNYLSQNNIDNYNNNNRDDNQIRPKSTTILENHHSYIATDEYHDSQKNYHQMFKHLISDNFSVSLQLIPPNQPLSTAKINSTNNTKTVTNSLTILINQKPAIGITNHEKPINHEDSHLNTVQNSLNQPFKGNPNFINDNYRIGLNTKLPIDVLLDVLRNLVPDSLVGATFQQTRTRLYAPKELIISANGSTDPPPSRWPLAHEMVGQANIIGLLAISVLTGVVLSQMEEASKPILDLCSCVAELSLRIGMLAINLTPFCVMFLLIGQVARTRDLGSVAGDLFMYSITVLLALAIHGFIVLTLIYYLVTKKSPLEFSACMLEAVVASFATSSSSATMALMLNCLTKLELNPIIVGAFGPLGSVFNMNGTAIYEAIGAIFIAQTLGVDLPITSLLLVGLTSAVASFSTCGIPSSGMLSMVIVLNAINLPVLQLSLLYIVDFAIDRFRTVVNVWSGAVVCALINHACPKHLFEEEMKRENYRHMIICHDRRITNKNSRRNMNLDENAKPKTISITITPPLENSYM